MVNAKDFGAFGDGKTDDTAAIQAALDYASTLEPMRFVEVFGAAEGVHVIGAPLHIPQGVRLTGTFVGGARVGSAPNPAMRP